MKVGETLVAAPKMQSITIRLPIEDYGWLQRQAEKTDQSVSYLIRRAIRMYIVASNKSKKDRGTENNGSNVC